MKSRYWIAGVGVIAPLILALLRFVPSSLLAWPATTDEFAKQFLTYLGVYFALTNAAMAGLLLKEAHASDAFRSSFAPPHVSATKLRDDEFYPRFFAAVERAKNFVWICYFAPRPPGNIDQQRAQYYDDMSNLIRRRRDIRFRRLIRYTEANTEWARSLLAYFDGCANIDIRMLSDLPAEVDNPNAMSVQIIDGESVWLVALGGHERTTAYRDLRLDGTAAAEPLIQYYDRLWRNGRELFSAGRLTEEGARLLGRT